MKLSSRLGRTAQGKRRFVGRNVSCGQILRLGIGLLTPGIPPTPAVQPKLTPRPNLNFELTRHPQTGLDRVIPCPASKQGLISMSRDVPRTPH